MKRLIFAVVLALAGCASSRPFTPERTCAVAGLGPVHLEDSRDCACISRVLARAVSIVDERVGPEDKDFSGVTVWIHEAGVEAERGHYRKAGDAGGEVELPRSMVSAAHEFLHHVELRQRAVSDAASLAHEGWGSARFGDSTNYRSTDEEFRRYHDPVRPGATTCP